MDNHKEPRVTEQAIDLDKVRDLPLPGPQHHDEYRRGYVDALMDVAALAQPRSTRQAAPEAPTAWIAYYDGVKSQNVARTLDEKAEIENIGRLMNSAAAITWEELYSRAPATQHAGAPVAWIATDLDGRAGVGFTKEAARREAGEGCTEFIPLYDLGGPAATTASASTDEIVTCAKCGWRVNSVDYCSVSNCPTSRAPAPSQEAAPLDWTEERITELAKSMAVEVAKNCSTVPQLTFPHIYLGLKEALAQQGAAQAKSVCRNCADFGWEPSISGERRPCEFCKPGAAQAAHAGATEILEQLAEKFERQHAWITNVAAANIVRAAIAASQPQKGSE